MSCPTLPSCTLFAVCLAFLVFCPGCDLPQNAGESTDVVESADSSATPLESRSWRLLKIIDRSLMDETTMPGLDLDAIVVFKDGAFISAGCKGTPVVYESDTTEGSEINEHADPEGGTLSVVDGEGSSGGFICMACGVLTCELPVPIVTGTIIAIIDVEDDGGEAWEARLAADAAGDYEDAALDMYGSGEFTAP